LTSHALPDLQLVHHVVVNQCQVEHNTDQITLLVIIATIFISINDQIAPLDAIFESSAYISEPLLVQCVSEDVVPTYALNWILVVLVALKSVF